MSVDRREYYKEYNRKNKDKRDAYAKSDANKAYRKRWKEKNKEKLKQQAKDYLINNREKIYEYQRQWLNENKDYMKEYHKEWKEKNRDVLIERRRYLRKNDPLYIISGSIRDLIYQSIKRLGYKKNSRTHEILGCSFEEFKIHIESKFQPWMTWENRGTQTCINKNETWDLDHIIPVSSGKTEEEIIKLNHYTNFQPLCSYVNRYIKRDNICHQTVV